MALPASRNTTYVFEVTPVKANDLNAIQDTLIAAYGDVHGDRTLVLPGMPNFTDQCAWDLGNGWVVNSGAPWTSLHQLVLPIGKRIKSISIQRLGNGASSMALALYKVTPGATAPTLVQNLAIPNPAAAWTDSTLDVAPDETIAADEYFYINVNGAGAAGTQKFKAIRVVYDQPVGNGY